MYTLRKTGSHSGIRGKIVLVPFPFDDFTVQKVRPALCLTDPIGKFSHVVVAFISSKIPEFIEDFDLVIDQKNENWADTGLLVPSVLKLHKLVSIPQNLILRELGVFPKKLTAILEGNMKSIFHLT